MFKILSICKGGGYKYCRTEPPHPRRNAKGLYPLHRVRMENKLGRLLESGEIVHHKNEDKEDDATKNLEVMRSGEHTRHHHPKDWKKLKCVQCGAGFEVPYSLYRARIKNNKSGETCCSRSCSVRRQHALEKAP